MSNIFFTGDHHFSHYNIIKYCDRPFSSWQEMDAVMIERWNKVVAIGDTVYYAGDFCLGSLALIDHLQKQLNGIIHLIRGNHDRHSHKKYLELGFASSQRRIDTVILEQKIIVVHRLRQNVTAPEDTWILYGHAHGKSNLRPNTLDVGVDNHNFTPVSFEQVKSLVGVQDEK